MDDNKKFNLRIATQMIERDTQELIDLVINHCQFEYRASRLILNLLNFMEPHEVREIIEDAHQPYHHGTKQPLNGDKLIRDAHCYDRLVKLKLTSKDIVKHRLSKWRDVIQFMTRENALQISGLMDDPHYLKKIKKRWGNVEER